MVLFLLVCCSASVTHSIEIFPSSVSVEEGQGFVFWLWTKNIPLENNCELRFGEVHIKTDEPVNSTPYGTIERVVTTNRNECAFRVKYATVEAGGTWGIHYSIDGLDNADRMQVTVLKRALGIECPMKGSDDFSCLLQNAKTGEQSPCENYLNLTSGGDSDWRCKYFVKGSMEAKGGGKVLVADEADTGTADLVWDSELDKAAVFDEIDDLGESSVVLKCQSDDKKEVTSCTAKHISSGRLYDLQPGLQTPDKKYSSYWTSLKSGRCQFEIVKPIALQDIGPWQISMTGGGGKKCSFIVRPQISETVTVKTMEGPNVTITCANNFSYPLRRCYMQSLDPNSTIEFKSWMDLRTGLCEFERPSDGKEFYCGYNAPSPSDKDIITQFKVVQYKNALIEANVMFQGNVGFAKVQEINGDPIAHCLILEPNGRLFSLAADQQSNENVPYSELAPGLEKGHCGIRFHPNPETEDEGGIWIFNVEMEDGRMLSLSYKVDASESSDM